ncbi:MAG: 50S ribosomal protein L11 methyltransferase [Pseudomonadota bacterium]
METPVWKVTWRGDETLLERGGALLSELYSDAIDAVGLNGPGNSEDAGEWSLDGYATESPDLPTLNKSLAAIIPGWEAVVSEKEELPETDWVAHALSGLGVVEAGRFRIFGIHDADKVVDDAKIVPIRIDANEAFGTGHHPTTLGCLSLLDRFAGFAPKNIFDLGCGSAVLAIAAAKLWGRTVLASDIDERSVEIANTNVALNGVAGNVKVCHADGFDHPDIIAHAPFDFVFANILAGPLAALAPDMAQHVKRNGRIVLAGVMTEQTPSVIDAYTKNQFRLINQLDHETWPVLLFVKT